MLKKLTLDAEAVHIWQANLNLAPQQLENLWNLLSPAEQQRALRFKFDLHRNRFIAAKGSLRLLLGEYLGIAPEIICFSTNTHGKPFLTKQSDKPLYFNASDSQDLALFALSHQEWIGVDLEFIRDSSDSLAIAQRFFSDHEYQYLLQLPATQQQTAFFKIWTLKEAFIKALGLGLSFPLKDFDVAIDNDKAYMAGIRADNLEKDDWSLSSFNISPEFTGAFAIKASLPKIEFFTFNLTG